MSPIMPPPAIRAFHLPFFVFSSIRTAWTTVTGLRRLQAGQSSARLRRRAGRRSRLLVAFGYIVAKIFSGPSLLIMLLSFERHVFKALVTVIRGGSSLDQCHYLFALGPLFAVGVAHVVFEYVNERCGALRLSRGARAGSANSVSSPVTRMTISPKPSGLPMPSRWRFVIAAGFFAERRLVAEGERPEQRSQFNGTKIVERQARTKPCAGRQRVRASS